MTAESLLAEGRLQEAYDAQLAAVRADPGAAEQRTFLFQLAAVLGHHERALSQLQSAAGMDPAAMPMAQTYGEAIRAESFRQSVFAGERTPSVFGEPGDWVGKMIEALRLDATAPGKGQSMREEALEAAPASPGKFGDQSFEWFSDADLRLGPIFEVVMQGRYLWVPVERVASVRFEEPTDLRDMVWTAAWFRWTNGGESAALVPTRYPGTIEQGDDACRLARKTDWVEAAEGLFHGIGQRVFTTDVAEPSLLDLREVVFEGGEDAGDG